MGKQVWKWLGVAGIAGVAATGALVARSERQRRSYTPDDIRTRLHEKARSIRQSNGESPTDGGTKTGYQ